MSIDNGHYYLKIHGLDTFPDPSQWLDFFLGFDDYATSLMTQAGLKPLSISVCGDQSCVLVADLGTLFDFIKN